MRDPAWRSFPRHDATSNWISAAIDEEDGRAGNFWTQRRGRPRAVSEATMGCCCGLFVALLILLVYGSLPMTARTVTAELEPRGGASAFTKKHVVSADGEAAHRSGGGGGIYGVSLDDPAAFIDEEAQELLQEELDGGNIGQKPREGGPVLPAGDGMHHLVSSRSGNVAEAPPRKALGTDHRHHPLSAWISTA